MEFPIVSKRQNLFPTEATCPWCRAARVFEPHSFVCLNGGALRMNPERDDGSASPDMDAWLDLTWHSSHSNCSDDAYVQLPIAADVVGGQFEAYFCSTACLRSFLNECVDELERRIQQD